MSFLDRLGEAPSKTRQPPTGVVTNSVEFARVLGLPRRVLDLSQVEDCTPLFRRAGGTMTMWPIQSACLIEAAQMNGLLGLIPAGDGKSLIALALPEAMASRRAVILTKSTLQRQVHIEIERIYSKHFNLPLDRITVVAYEELSSASKADVLERLDPDLIIADEAHCIASHDSARGKRFRRFAADHPGCRYAFLSGTITNRSISDYAPLAELALRKNSPLPRGYREVADWGGAIDVKPQYEMRPGALMKLCDDGEDVRAGYRRRLIETAGVVARSESDIGTSLVIRRLAPMVPPKVTQLLDSVRKNWKIGDDELSQATDVFRTLREVACGFYYRWCWPGGIVDDEWLEARSAWNREVREQLSRSRPGFDSPYLLALAAERAHTGKSTAAPVWDSETWSAWRELKDQPPPPTEAVWVDDFLVRESLDWGTRALSVGPAIIWHEHIAVGERIAKDGGLPHFGAGTDASQSKLSLIVCSRATQSTGKNLQHYNQNLITSLMPNGEQFEQLVARTHRSGQLADEVVVEWFGHTPETQSALAQIIEDAEYVQESTTQRQRVLRATRIG